MVTAPHLEGRDAVISRMCVLTMVEGLAFEACHMRQRTQRPQSYLNSVTGERGDLQHFGGNDRATARKNGYGAHADLTDFLNCDGSIEIYPASIEHETRCVVFAGVRLERG